MLINWTDSAILMLAGIIGVLYTMQFPGGGLPVVCVGLLLMYLTVLVADTVRFTTRIYHAAAHRRSP
jgi:hypothetical protein